MDHPTNSTDSELTELCKQGRIPEAIRLYKKTSGKGLQESKLYIDDLILEHGISLPENKGACFIATACFGNYDAPEVLLLRQFRDKKLLTFFGGKILVQIYYALSPPFASLIARSATLKKFVRILILKPIILKLK